jgi:hypothetical protein
MPLVCFPKGLAEAYVKGMVLSRPAAERSLCEYHDIVHTLIGLLLRLLAEPHLGGCEAPAVEVKYCHHSGVEAIGRVRDAD